ncbi:hypothetical protein OCU04_001348 [Sclerotinia nivalis]|uniref:Uncharacterized protein n=1 Tax=Sclerotinia nivalis TaxID=352851 RepID=A0A9X0DPB5_9HELO|nr:hypothetical protein OCU04_001348 [Sclerotinia nivalis]
MIISVVRDKPDQDPKTMTEVGINHVHGALQVVVLKFTTKRIDSKDRIKKLLAYKLALIGFSASTFVFQMDPELHSRGRITRSEVAELLGEYVLHPMWPDYAATLSKYIGRLRSKTISVYMYFIVVFISSIVFALAENMNTITVSRLLQGFGGEVIDVLV